MTDRIGIPLSNGYQVDIDAAVNTDPEAASKAVRLPVQTYLSELETWSRGAGLPYGLRVDVAGRTVSKAGG